MSITFTTAIGPLMGWAVSCACGEGVGPVVCNYAEAVAYLTPLVEDESLRSVLVGCEDGKLCLMYRLSLTTLEATPPEVNMSNNNAADIFASLGFISDDPALAAEAAEVFHGGSLDAADFLGRVLFALAISPSDEGRPSFEMPRTEGGMMAIACGRRVGYIQTRLGELHDLAQWAIANNREVTLG